ncbi:MAG: C25 family cysteine peptidase [Anaerolineae bacterium]
MATVTYRIRTCVTATFLLSLLTAVVHPLPVTAAAPQSGSAYRVTVDRTGMYRLTYSDLVNAGVPVADLAPQHLHLTSGYPAVEVASEITGASDGRFDPTDEIRFYGQARDSKYGAMNTYWLAYDNTDGVRMAVRNGTPANGTTPSAFQTTAMFEQDLLYRSSLPFLDQADHWFWDGWAVEAGHSQTISFTLSVTNPVAAAASLLVAYQGEFFSYIVSPDHHVQVVLNGHLLGEATWDEALPFNKTFNFDGGWLLRGDNTVAITAFGDTGLAVESGYVDFMTLTYQRTFASAGAGLQFDADGPGAWHLQATGFGSSQVVVYDVTNAGTPQAISQVRVQPVGNTFTLDFSDVTGAETHYVAVGDNGWLTPRAIQADTPSDLHNSANGADYIVISYPDFLSAVQPLADYRASTGLRVKVVNVQDVYDEFGGGLLSAEALHDFLQFTYSQWTPPAPRYVLLVGDGTYDFKDVAGRGNQTFIPPYLALVDALNGETAADNDYVNFDSDPLPEMAIGRFPVKTAAQTSTIVNKVLAYEATPVTSDWMRKATLVADKYDPLAGNFAALSDEGLAYFPPEYSVDRIYYGTASYPTAQTVYNALLGAVNNGRFLVNYTGHGDSRSWGGSLLRSLHVSNMVNGNRLPVITTMGCEVGYFIFPYYDALSEVLVTQAGGGAVATWAGSGRGTSIGQQWLYKGFLSAVFEQGVNELGVALDLAKQHLLSNAPQWVSLVHTFHLFGDPALRFPMPRAETNVTMTATPTQPRAGEMITLTVAFANQGQLVARSSQLTVTLPSEVIGGHFFTEGNLGEVRSAGAQSTLTYSLGDLAAGQTGTLYVVGTLAAILNPGTPLSVAAQARSVNPDGNPQNNAFDLTVTVGQIQGSLGGVNFVDTNGNGLRDGDEVAGLAGIPVAILNGSGAVVRLTTSGPMGAWRVDGLDPGAYSAAVDPQGLVITTPSHVPVTLEAGASILDVYFGFLQPTAVMIVSFEAVANDDNILVNWQAISQRGDELYQVERSLQAEDGYVPVSPLLASATHPDGRFTWEDDQVEAGQVYWYRLVIQPGNTIVGPVAGYAGGQHLFIPLVSR